MKKFNLSIFLFIATFAVAFSQVPSAFNYQAVVRNSSGEIISNQSVSFKISILEDTESGTVVYSETHTLSTNKFGLVNFEIGNGENITGTFTPVGWGASSHFIKVEIAPAGGTSFSHLATSKLVSVPYAFHAQTVENDAVDDADADPSNEIQTITLTGTLLELSDGGGSVTLPTSGSSSGDNWGAQVVKTNTTLTGNGTTTNPLGVTGDLTDDQTLSVSGDDLTISDGNTVTLPNNSKWNTGTYGISHTNSHVGIGADATDGSSLTVMNTIGNALFAGNNDAMNPPLQVYNQNANGAAAYFRNKIIIKDGTHGEGKVLTSDTNGNTSWQTPAVSSLWTPSGGNIVYSEGSVNVGGATPDSRILLQSSTSSNLYALGAINNGSNPTIYAMNNGTGPSAWIAGKVKITDGTESNGKVLTSDADGLASWQTPEESPWYHNTSGIQYTAGRVFVGSTTTNTANKLSISTMSDLHCMYAINSGNTRATLYAVNLGTGHAAEFRNKIKIVDGTEGEGKVLTSDAVGFTSWQTPATSSSLWTESGSNVYRSSGNVGIGTTSPTAALEISSSSAPSIIISSSTNNDPTRPGIQFKRNNSHFFSGDDVSDEAFGFYSIWASIRNYDAKLRVHGNASGSWGTYLELTHNGTDGIIKTDVGDVYISPATQKVGINTTSPTESLHVDGNARFEKIGSGAYFGVVNRTSDGTLTTASSDIRLKENIATLNNSLDKIMQLRGVSFTWKTNPEYGKRIGFIAQEFEQVIPELSFTNEVDGYKGINYAEVSVVLVEAVREQQKIIESLKTVNDQLKADNTEIINRLEKLETLISISAQK